MRSFQVGAVIAMLAAMALADPESPRPSESLIAKIKYVELDADGKESNRIILQAPIATSGPCTVSISCSSNYRVRVQVSALIEAQPGSDPVPGSTRSQLFRADIRIVKINADKSESVLASNVKLTFPRESRGTFLSEIPVQIGVKVAAAPANGMRDSEEDPVPEIPALFKNVVRPAGAGGFSAPR